MSWPPLGFNLVQFIPLFQSGLDVSEAGKIMNCWNPSLEVHKLIPAAREESAGNTKGTNWMDSLNRLCV